MNLMQTPSVNSSNNKKMIVKVGKDSVRQQRFQISLLKQIADLHNIKSNTMCKVKLLLPDYIVQQSPDRKEEEDTVMPYVIDRIELSFRDQLVSRRDMWKIQLFL